jgi:transposase-like protein
MAQQFVEDNIAKQLVVIFSKSYCPYCTMAKEVRKVGKNRETSKVTHEICFEAIQKGQL